MKNDNVNQKLNNDNNFSFCSNFNFIGKRKVHYTFTDGTEMAEEYDMKTGELSGK